jgi:hypothetical protein
LAFDFASAPRSNTKRRSKRAGKSLKSKAASKEAHTNLRADSLDELCNRFAALCLDSDEPTANNLRPVTPSGCYTPNLSTVRHYWAPQFRPNSVPRSTSTPSVPFHNQSKALELDPVSPLPPAQKSSVAVTTTDPASASHTTPNRFPLSAFLKDIISPADCVGSWLPQSHAASEYSQGSVTQPATPDQSTATAAPCCVLELHANAIARSNNAVSALESPTVPLSTAAAGIDKGSPVQTPSVASPLDSSPNQLPAVPPTLVAMTNAPKPSLPHDEPSSALQPATALMIRAPLPIAQYSSTADRSRSRSPSRSPRPLFDYAEPSEGIPIFHPAPSTFVTAPFTSPYPFVYPPRPWTPTSVANDLFKTTAAAPSMLRRRIAVGTSSREVQKEVEDFLTKGHAKDCWCSGRKTDIESGERPVNIGTEQLSSQIDAADGQVKSPEANSQEANSQEVNSQEVSSDTTTSVTDAFIDTSNDTDCESSPGDGIMVTPGSEGTNGESEEFEIIDGQPVESDGDEWLAVSPGLHAHQPDSLPTSRSISNTSAQHQPDSLPTSEPATADAATQVPAAPVAVTSPCKAPPSPPQTPLISAHQTQGSDAVSETG